MTIEKLAAQLQEQIDQKMEEFSKLGKQAKKLRTQIDKAHQDMSAILLELQPVDSLIRAQHPDKCELFDVLLEYQKDKNE